MTIPVGAVLDSLARHLHDNSVAVYSPAGTYPTASALPVVWFGQLHDAPDLAVAVNHYLTDPNTFTQQHTPTMRFQLRWRGDRNPATVHAHADAAYDVLHTLTPGPWPGGLRPTWVQRLIVAPIEPDTSGRWQRCDSYEIQLNPIGATP